MANTVTSNELNVVQGFGERQLLRNLKEGIDPTTVGAGSLVMIDPTSGDFILSAGGEAPRAIFVTQNNADNRDAVGTQYDFVGAQSMVIGIPAVSGAEVEIPVADTTGFAVGGTVEAGVGVIAVGDGTADIGLVTELTDNSVTVLLG